MDWLTTKRALTGATKRSVGRLLLGSAASACVVLGLSLAASGCYVEAGPPPPPPGYVADYQPSYYDGYVVYYDDYGRPYYYANGAVVWVSPRVAEYGLLVRHYRLYGPAYHRWYVHYGPAYRGYHRYYRR